MTTRYHSIPWAGCSDIIKQTWARVKGPETMRANWGLLRCFAGFFGKTAEKLEWEKLKPEHFDAFEQNHHLYDRWRYFFKNFAKNMAIAGHWTEAEYLAVKAIADRKGKTHINADTIAICIPDDCRRMLCALAYCSDQKSILPEKIAVIRKREARMFKYGAGAYPLTAPRLWEGAGTDHVFPEFESREDKVETAIHTMNDALYAAKIEPALVRRCLGPKGNEDDEAAMIIAMLKSFSPNVQRKVLREFEAVWMGANPSRV